jgi:hypothetical protein
LWVERKLLFEDFKMSKNKEAAEKIVAMAKKLGWKMWVRGLILEIEKSIVPGDNDSFVTADMEYYSILGLLPSTSPGSIWGTDGGGIGALSAMNSGRFVMKKSGGSKMVLKALEKML